MRSALVLLASIAVAAPASAREPKGVEPVAALGGLITSDDYPEEAIELGQQGAVTVRLRVGSDGQVKRCEVIVSSESEALDARTCAILSERARFKPATDSRGRAVEGIFQQRITWILEEDAGPTRQQTVLLMWISCALGETAKLAVTDLPAEQVRDRALAACSTLERMVQAEVATTAADAAPSFEELRKSTGDKVVASLNDMRARLERED